MAASRSISITYVPADCGSIIPGKSKAPQAFRDVGIVGKLRDAGVLSVSEHHALKAPTTFSATMFSAGGARNEDVNIAVCEAVERTIGNNLRASAGQPDFQLVLGGECCMLPAILSAFWKQADSQSPSQRVGLIYIDADTDLTSPADPSSIGTFAGMNMAHLVRLPEHFKYLFDNNFKVVSSAAVAKDPEQRARETLEFLQDNVDIIMVHLDVDSIDPGTFPLANVPNFTGVEFENMMRALKVLLGSQKVGGLTVAEVNPDHDPGLEMTERLTCHIVDMLAARK
ncbi:Arginase [Fusarium phyllophilum]|uniref:Arginase n=1 Tax=Fusarium phyllophilum TaxID=47803 RepID=A0A8H5KDA6_9HYPO|nr:Arginase [Fusarium phyllophilum]